MDDCALRRRSDALALTVNPLGAVSSLAHGHNQVTGNEGRTASSDTDTDTDNFSDAGNPGFRPPRSSDSELSTAWDGPLPPTVSFVLRDIEARYTNALGREHSCWTEYYLEEDDWELLKQRLDEKIRHRYFPQTRTFIHEMLSLTHEVCNSRFLQILNKKGGRLCTSAEEEEFMDKLLNLGSADIEAREGKGQQQADAFICHFDSADYGVCLEVAYSQKRDKLPPIAEFWLRNSIQETQLLICIDFDYSRSKKVTLSTWRSDQLEPHFQILRTDDGALVPGDSLQISMFDLARREVVPASLHRKSIEFTAQDFYDIVQVAEETQIKLHQKARAQKSTPVVPDSVVSQSDDVDQSSGVINFKPRLSSATSISVSSQTRSGTVKP